mmetsp:Transcript_38046/g.104669  ORF Transcript_38046/g.104669 Transcript_38046/m.104669 type:complete len:243 (+) Transcript_38046:1203-1931(+)
MRLQAVAGDPEALDPDVEALEQRDHRAQAAVAEVVPRQVQPSEAPDAVCDAGLAEASLEPALQALDEVRHVPIHAHLVWQGNLDAQLCGLNRHPLESAINLGLLLCEIPDASGLHVCTAMVCVAHRMRVWRQCAVGWWRPRRWAGPVVRRRRPKPMRRPGAGGWPAVVVVARVDWRRVRRPVEMRMRGRGSIQPQGRTVWMRPGVHQASLIASHAPSPSAQAPRGGRARKPTPTSPDTGTPA